MVTFMNHSVAAAAGVAPTPIPTSISISTPTLAVPVRSPTESAQSTEALVYGARRSASADQDDDEGLSLIT